MMDQPTPCMGPSHDQPDVRARWLPAPLGNCSGLGPSAGLCPRSLVAQRCPPLKVWPVDRWSGVPLILFLDCLFFPELQLFTRLPWRQGDGAGQGSPVDLAWVVNTDLWGLTRGPGGSSKAPSFSLEWGVAQSWVKKGRYVLHSRPGCLGAQHSPFQDEMLCWLLQGSLPGEAGSLQSLFSRRFYFYANRQLRA